MKKIKVIKDVTYDGRFNGKTIDIDGYEPIEGIKAGFCEETGTRCEFSKIDEIEVIKWKYIKK